MAAPGGIALWAGACALAMTVVGTVQGAPPLAPGKMEMPRYSATGHLTFPADYREWQFVSAGHGMTYNDTASASADAPFDNVFVQREAYQAFKATGHWPEGTILMLEIRGGAGKGSINKHGAFQQGEAERTEAHVRDKRFPGGWAFFRFEGSAAPAPASLIPRPATCYSCHEANAAVDTTFVQFYPTLLPIATAKGTLSEAYRHAEASAPRP